MEAVYPKGYDKKGVVLQEIVEDIMFQCVSWSTSRQFCFHYVSSQGRINVICNVLPNIFVCLPFQEFVQVCSTVYSKMNEEVRKRKSGAALLKQYSPWLSDFQASNYQQVLEIPGKWPFFASARSCLLLGLVAAVPIPCVGKWCMVFVRPFPFPSWLLAQLSAHVSLFFFFFMSTWSMFLHKQVSARLCEILFAVAAMPISSVH